MKRKEKREINRKKREKMNEERKKKRARGWKRWKKRDGRKENSTTNLANRFCI